MAANLFIHMRRCLMRVENQSLPLYKRVWMHSDRKSPVTGNIVLLSIGTIIFRVIWRETESTLRLSPIESVANSRNCLPSHSVGCGVLISTVFLLGLLLLEHENYALLYDLPFASVAGLTQRPLALYPLAVLL